MEYYLCVLDFEATCWDDNYKPKSEMEIIEFPSVLYKINEQNSTYIFISEFQEYVKPSKNDVSEFCTELTGITQTMVEFAPSFSDVYNKHIEWLNTNVPADKTFIIATCGHWDLRTQIHRDIKNHKLKLHSYYYYYINVKDEYENFYKMKARGMPCMLESLGLTLDGRHHSGIDDTKNIAKIILHLISEGREYKHFIINQSK